MTSLSAHPYGFPTGYEICDGSLRKGAVPTQNEAGGGREGKRERGGKEREREGRREREGERRKGRRERRREREREGRREREREGRREGRRERGVTEGGREGEGGRGEMEGGKERRGWRFTPKWAKITSLSLQSSGAGRRVHPSYYIIANGDRADSLAVNGFRTLCGLCIG